MKALTILKEAAFPCLELSALRMSELKPLLTALPQLDLVAYSYVSFHAPSSFAKQEEKCVADMLYELVPQEWPIILHPDEIIDFNCWARFGSRLAIENMDRRKAVGRTACELQDIFNLLPAASLCFDVAHARQCDASMTEAFLIATKFRNKLVQVHISEVNSDSQHNPISYGARIAFQQIAGLIPEETPIIIESKVQAFQLRDEASNAMESLMIEELV